MSVVVILIVLNSVVFQGGRNKTASASTAKTKTVDSEKEAVLSAADMRTVAYQESINGLIGAGKFHTVGLKADGTVVATGVSSEGRCDVDGWMDIVAFSAGAYHTVGLKSDGTVVATKISDSDYDYDQCNVDDWRNMMLPKDRT